ncbi:ATP-grasp domain-containing protein [Methylophaga sp.]|uniref:ATP-grasp domain-containing protein n=1 Tax=Methylophaga sp. TaxID=2024840 RepID=UPI003A8F1AB5
MKRIGLVYQNVNLKYLFDEAESIGYELVLFNPEVSDDFSHKSVLAQESLDIFSEGAADLLIEKSNNYKLDGLVTIYDRAIPLIAEVNEKLGFVGIPASVAPNVRSKTLMKKCFTKHGVSTAKSFEVDLSKEISLQKIIDEIGPYPFIIKPSNGYGGDNVVLAYNLEETLAALEYIARTGNYQSALIEEFIGGTEYIVDSFSIDRKHHVLSIASKGVPKGPYFEEPYHIAGKVVEAEIVDKVVSEVSKALDSLGLINGPSHTEIKVFNDNVYIIEIGARIGGEGVCHFLVKESTGVNFAKLLLDWAAGVKIEEDLPTNPKPYRYSLNYNIRVNKGGILKSIQGLELLKDRDNVTDIIVISKKNDEIKPYPDFSGYPGFVHSTHQSYSEVEDFISYMDRNLITEYNQ